MFPVSYTHLDVYKRQLLSVPNRRAGKETQFLRVIRPIDIMAGVWNQFQCIRLFVALPDHLRHRQILRRNTGDNAMEMHSPIPVSYTHLDVYKRQAKTYHFAESLDDAFGLLQKNKTNTILRCV